MTQHRTLVRSSVIAATASVSLITTSANAAIILYTNEADLISDMTGIGASRLFLEDFEDHAPLGAYGYTILSNPLDQNPNGPFENGIVDGLTVRSSGGGLAAFEPSPYSGNITSSVVGTFQSSAGLGLEFDGVAGIGFDLWGIETFLDLPPDEVEYSIYDVAGGLLGTGMIPTDDSANGVFIGMASTTDLIGSVEIFGFKFGLATTEMVDNVQAWAVPAPGALALLGLAGLAGSRRRRC